jgi:excisionase family DNA binding protein
LISERLVTTEQAAELLCVSRGTMDDWIQNGEIRSTRADDGSSRIRESEIVNLECLSCFQRGCELASSPHTVDDAALYFKRAIKANPRFNLAYFELGRMYYTWGRYYEADEHLRKSIELKPCFPAWMNYAYNFFEWGRFHEAERALRIALQIVPDHADAMYKLGFSIMITSFYQPDRLREAVEHFRKALDLRPELEMPAWFLGETLVLHLGAFEEARIYAQEIHVRLPHIAEHIRRIIELNQSSIA